MGAVLVPVETNALSGSVFSLLCTASVLLVVLCTWLLDQTRPRRLTCIRRSRLPPLALVPSLATAYFKTPPRAQDSRGLQSQPHGHSHVITHGPRRQLRGC